MKLNLPILDKLEKSKNILIAGMGGGFDVFCGLPVYFELKALGYSVHLASYSFSEIWSLTPDSGGIHLSETLIGVTADMMGFHVYFPELYLSQWFKEKRSEDITIWSFHKTGARYLLEDYRLLVKHLEIDTILLVDGGVDSLNRGDEMRLGTLVEDTISLACVHDLDNIQTKMVICIGFGAELDMAYAHVLQNIAELTKAQACFGSCALLPQMTVYQSYREAVLYVQAKPYQDPSVINSSIISAVEGMYGNYHLTDKTKRMPLWISPLMTLYWFFDLTAVAERSLMLDGIRKTTSREDMFHISFGILQRLKRRDDKGDIPL